MNDSISLLLYDRSGQVLFTLTKNITLRFEKEYYTPYTSLKASFVFDGDISSVTEAELVVNGHYLHRGIVDTLNTYFSGGARIISITSRGKTSMLLNNELPEGILSNPSLNVILDQKKIIPGVTHENLSQTVNYIYVMEHASVWEVLTNLCLKQYNSCPFISGTNCVRFTKNSSVTFSPTKITEKGAGTDFSKIISACHMKDANDEYTFNRTDAEAVGMGIVREKYLPLDRQWLADSQTGLSYRINFGMRGYKYSYLGYNGFSGEDINDVISYGGKASEISRIVITSGKNGLSTRLYSYFDRYCNKS